MSCNMCVRKGYENKWLGLGLGLGWGREREREREYNRDAINEYSHLFIWACEKTIVL